MEISGKNEACACGRPAMSGRERGWPGPWKLLLGAAAVGAWFFIYSWLLPTSRFFTYRVFGLTPGTHLADAMEFFLYDSPKVLMLLTLVVFFVGIIRSFFTPERTRRILAGRREIAGNGLAAMLGIVTPFCSCSAVPLFIGFVSAGVPLGVTFSFLISAPMVNEIAVVLLYGLLGWKVAALYMGMGLAVAVAAGWTLGRMRLEGYIEDWVLAVRNGEGEAVPETMSANARLAYAWGAVREIVGRTWKWVLAGIAVGAGIHGYVPEGFMASIMGQGNWWSVPLAVLIGIPMYSNAAGIVPVVQALLAKGAALGTVLAFMMSVIALSLPEMVILRKVLKVPLLVAFAAIVGCGILLVGYVFNALL